MKHTFYECHCGRYGCMFCDGGLASCIICGGFEGTLTTECCGRKITKEEEHKIYDEGSLDFKDGQWVNQPTYGVSSHFAKLEVKNET